MKTILSFIFVVGLSTSTMLAQQPQKPVTKKPVASKPAPNKPANAIPDKPVEPPKETYNFSPYFSPFRGFPEHNDSIGQLLSTIVKSTCAILDSSVMDWQNSKLYYQSALNQIEQIKPLAQKDPLAKNMYTFGTAFVYETMALSGLYKDDSLKNLAQLALKNYNTYLELKDAIPALAYAHMITLTGENALNDTAKALIYINKALAASPEDHMLYITKFQMMVNANNKPEACEVLKKALAAGMPTAKQMIETCECDNPSTEFPESVRPTIPATPEPSVEEKQEPIKVEEPIIVNDSVIGNKNENEKQDEKSKSENQTTPAI